MKKIIILTLLIGVFTFALSYSTPYMSVLAQNSSCFARIKYNNVLLYKTATQNNDYSNVYCILEPTYFVEILNEENKLFFKVNYLDLTGFVQKNQVECVNETPATPYPNNITFNTTNFSNVILRNKPTAEEETSVLVLEPNTSLIYYGKIVGESAISSQGNIWYYCKYNLNQNIINGYVYSPLTHNFKTIEENLEVSTISEYGTFSEVNALLQIRPKFHFLLIAITVLPSFILIFLFFKGGKKEIN